MEWVRVEWVGNGCTQQAHTGLAFQPFNPLGAGRRTQAETLSKIGYLIVIRVGGPTLSRLWGCNYLLPSTRAAETLRWGTLHASSLEGHPLG
jgi:hypothetical protein